MRRTWRWREPALFMVLLLVLSYLYLRPATDLLLQGRADLLLGDTSDSTELPFWYALIVKQIETAPTDLLYGTVHTYSLNPPNGLLLWITWIEKTLVVILSPFLAVEQMPSAIAWIEFTLNGVSMWALGYVLGWHPVVRGAAGICWAINAFTRARASAHLGMAATFYLPLLFLAAWVLGGAPRLRGRFVAVGALLLACLSHPYFAVGILLLLPFLALVAWWSGQGRLFRKPRAADWIVVAAPALFLVWTYGHFAPAHYLRKGTQVPVHPVVNELFMNQFGAKPLDYLAFDPKLGIADWNPLRERINLSVARSGDWALSHERSHGIRWSILLLAGCALWAARRRQSGSLFDASERKLVWLFGALGLLGFWTSLSPESLDLCGIRFSPFILLNKLVPRLRVPGRFSTFVQFAAIVLAAIYANAWVRRRMASASSKIVRGTVLGVLPTLIIFEYAPIHPVWVSPVFPPLTKEETTEPECGTGMFIPYLAGEGSMEIADFYVALQLIRGSSCRIANLPYHDERNASLLRAFATPILAAAKNVVVPRRQLLSRVEGFARCSDLDWFYFTLDVDQPFREEVCARLGWRMVSPRVCRKGGTRNRFAWREECLQRL